MVKAKASVRLSWNLSFMYVNPTGFAELGKRVEDLYKAHEQELEEANRILRQKIVEDQFLDLVSVETEVRLVYKELYSIYKTTLKSNSSINEVNQVAQLRIIIKPKSCNGVGPLCTAQQTCYHVLGLVHGIWTLVSQAVEDHIATPKPNGYQSLHTIVIPFLNESMFHLEVQIRIEVIDLIAERGIAAHYSGRGVVSGPVRPGISSGRNAKGKVICLNNTGFALRIGWLNAIREWQEEFVGNMSSREFVDTITRDLLGSRVFSPLSSVVLTLVVAMSFMLMKPSQEATTSMVVVHLVAVLVGDLVTVLVAGVVVVDLVKDLGAGMVAADLMADAVVGMATVALVTSRALALPVQERRPVLVMIDDECGGCDKRRNVLLIQ
ncbi:putative GTP diphosphokinase RSH1, chloroplastic [Zea mays]|uniref:Putative GTP diphosphokinase RSH1, chloroplastic n=1 Tax=Zea mays TaxID=4577 RepID=A0A3L6ET17_MAIZE|nr:putative GTP diphosphokinase RSH1, chloroplastic [Zea mays]